MRRRKTYTVACLSGDGVGPELMAEACRALAEVSRLHGFRVEDVHVPFGSEAVSRAGNPLPATTRAAYLGADAVLVAIEREPVLADVESELDLRATLTRVRFGANGAAITVSPYTSATPGFRSILKFDDVDDYNGYKRLVNTPRAEGYTLSAKVAYASPTWPDSTKGTQTWCKKFTVTVKSPYMPDSLVISYAFLY